MIKWLCLCLLLGSCAQESAPEKTISEPSTGGAGERQELTPNLASTLGVQKCGEKECSPRASRCTEGDLCGRATPTEMFASSCIAEANRGGELSADCPESPEYCFLRGCKSYKGCTLKGGGCGYWVDGYEIVGGVEVTVVSLDLVPRAGSPCRVSPDPTEVGA